MKILSIDTSGQTACAGITANDNNGYITLAEMNISGARAKLTHSEILLPMIDRLFKFTGLTIEDIDYIACVNGPGSFTGLRIGAATAQGLARGAGKKLVPVPALDSLAYNIGTHEGYIMPMMDARRSQTYTAVYASGGDAPKRVTEYLAVQVTEALAVLYDAIQKADREPRIIFLGDGASAYEAEIEKEGKALGLRFTFAPPNANRQRAASAGYRAFEMLAGGFEPAEAFSLFYIRKPQAERLRHE
ncbi:MAG: tRNA (adenosine(37)-N6)-threonylcarbamoyltransferase complex dimerization subunit type 1 TsaB [Clostridiales bacterium]|jgi:tRNA threonylcarbamoyladenosine biosynthesis protein TsaB|nr:tRNA (adenosine(37)-N6)-threonylcarbamoyltransferase complex dimerization subunit type 1 TsaB [Clostridiales bacterium]